MEKSLYMAAMKGDTDFLPDASVREVETGHWDEYLQSKTPQSNNILHIASLHGKLNFIQHVLTLINFSPLKLISKENVNGETPLHIVSKKGNLPILRLLVSYCNLNVGSKAEGEIDMLSEIGNDELTHRPWRVQNLEGNTPLHVAIIHGRIGVARYLVKLDDQVTGFVNNRQETPLHLAVQHNAMDDKQLVVDTIELINKQHASLTYKASKCPTKQESLQMIQILLQINNAPQVLYMLDEDGLTPLLRAATVSNVGAIRAIVTEFPETTEVRDSKGRAILHLVKIENYEEAKTLVTIPQIVCLKDQQDCLGNTPAFVAVKDIIDCSCQKKMDIIDCEHQLSHICCGFGMLKALLASSANFTIKNKEGFSAATLIQQHKTMFSNMGKVQLDEEINLKVDSKPSSSPISQVQIPLIRDAIQKANLEYLTNNVMDLGHVLSSYDCLGGGNVLHGVLKAWKAKYDNIYDDNSLINFVEIVLQQFPILLCQGDFNGDTPLHILVRDDHEITQSFLRKIESYFEKSQKGLASDEELYCPPWKVKNVEGNTPLHEALLNSTSPTIDNIVLVLKDDDASVFELVNNRNETPLHVLCRRDVKLEKNKQVTRNVLEAYKCGAYKRDKEGLTPLLTAAQSGNIDEVETICEICPQSAQLRDNKGKIFWHVIELSKTSRAIEKDSMSKLLQDEQIKQLLLHVKDYDGKTPVEVAIALRNYHLLKALQPCKQVFNQVEDILSKGDIETQLLLPTITYANHLPPTLEQIVWDILKKVPDQSFFGVQESEISNYTQTLGVVAVLLATIAFTAAFTVPGGFRQQHEYLNKSHTSVPFGITPSGAPDSPNVTSDLIGTPVLLGTDLIPFLTTTAYWIFMVSDIITMCLSTFVVYCLLWIMKNSPMRMVLIDLSIFTIQICFYTVMITFMMGVFATTLRVDSSLAYLAVIVCSTVMFLMNRWLFPIKTIFLIFAVFYEAVVKVVERHCKCPCPMSRCSTSQEK